MFAAENMNQPNQPTTIPGVSRFTEFDIYLFKEGKHYSLYNKLGAHIMEYEGIMGTYFAIWAPNAEKISVIGDFNAWNRGSHPLYVRLDSSGIWEGFIPNLGHGTVYKYYLTSRVDGFSVEKGDPYGLLWEVPPRTASIVWDITHKWTDKAWLERRLKLKGVPQPYSVYELHIGSWKRIPDEGNRSLTYREMAHELPGYIKELGFTHIEFMPVMEHPFYGSWGYQVTGYFAPSSRFGTPQDFMYLINALHEEGIGVILDWVPSHFPSDEHGLAYFDGTHLYEHADMRKGYHPDWKSYIFNYSRNEVRSFLISNALFWLDVYHADGLRVDAVASMLYLDYSRKEGEWIPNEYGGRENLEAISFLKEFNTAVYGNFPDVQTIAEESTAWPMVSRPAYIGGLGFGMKWMMGWMHDTLEYFAKESVYRKFHQNMLTFSLYYAFTENFMLPLSHDEVVYGKKPLIYKMPGEHWQQFANLRLLYGYMFAHPGTKLLFMGGEFGQTTEWAHESSLDWHLLAYAPHQGMKQLMSALNTLYKEEGALYEYSFEESGFEWIDYNDSENSVLTWLRKGKAEKDQIIAIANFTPVPRENYYVGVPKKGYYAQILNTDAAIFGGSDVGNMSVVESLPVAAHGRENCIAVTLPPLAIMYFKYQKKAG